MPRPSKIVYKPSPWSGLAGALSERYKSQDPADIGARFAEEIGLRPYKLRAKEYALNTQTMAGDDQKMGDFNPDTGLIRMDQDLSQEEKSGTLPHELAHVADYMAAGYTPPEGNPQGFRHHRDFASLEAELPRVLTTQKEKEMGLPISPTASRRYPWLSDVNPLSSNRMANPWADRLKANPWMPSPVWNALQGEQR
jgi:hypothetical protein